ncbi:MAG: HD domain-containing protein [Candidatus Colwellbacteria bacterium]|nr:HD domain-containing protein [Candidatus Colwellbacteria bacterium]
MKFSIPEPVLDIIKKLEASDFQAFIVGGCVRDLILGREPQDWDVATGAKPEEIQKLFPDSVYENEFGTVAVKTGSTDPKLAIIEVTTFRSEEKYSDFRHPDKISFAKTIKEDLARRDFTINALAINIGDVGIVDPFDGQQDLKKKLIRAVGEPKERFEEDALRLMRAVRFSAELGGFSARGGPASGWKIEEKTALAIKETAPLLKHIAQERIRDEFVKIIMAKNGGPYAGIIELEAFGLLKYFLPELREGIEVNQAKHHIFTVWEHNLLSLDYAARQNYSLEVRLGSLFHDAAKPRVKRGEGEEATFYNHEVVGAKMTRQILERLHFSKKVIDKVVHLVRWHLFYYNVGEVTEAGVRRFISRVGLEHIDDLLRVREADRIGSGVPKAFPYKLRHLQFMIEKVRTDPIGPKMLGIKGDEIMKILGIEPGPRVGWILGILLEEVLDDPSRNERQYLESRIKNLGDLSDDQLKKLADKAKDRKEEFESGIEEEIKKRHRVS